MTTMLTSIGTQSTCASTVSNYYATVREEIYEFSTSFILCALTGSPSTSTSANDLYKELLTLLGLTDTAERERSFNKAFAEIIHYAVVNCTRTAAAELASANLISLSVELTSALNAGADKNTIRDLYGQILSLQTKMTGVGSAIKTFLASLSPEHQACIFGLEGTSLSLAFVVDDTGSMSSEIAAVQNIINLFVSSTEFAVSDYILTTFNDPSMSYCD